MKKKIHLSMINLGCNKNLVDSQLFLGKLLSENEKDIEYYSDPSDKHVELVILNTCSFISSGREEMFQTIEDLLSQKKKICIIGCGVQYFEKLLKNTELLSRSKLDNESTLQLKTELEKWNKLLKNENISYISWNDLSSATLSTLINRSQNFDDFCRYSTPRLLTNYENRYEYLKIAEGCNNSCAFCIIPQIRGKLISLPIKTVINDAENLLKQGIEELIIVAQDTMRYGTDFSSKSQLLSLLNELDKLPYDFKYRILYLYPDILTLKQLEEFSKLEKFIPYFDIPLQHISPKLLKSMGRFYDDKMIHSLLKGIRKIFPDSFIRTNIIVGFPGETDEDFKLLTDFLSEDYFDNIALFEYHDEPLAPSFKFKNKLEDSTIHNRFKIINKQVNNLLFKREKNRKNKKRIGYVEEIKQVNKGIILTVRPEIHCPEIDSVDKVQLKNIIQCFDGDVVNVGSKVEYILN